MNQRTMAAVLLVVVALVAAATGSARAQAPPPTYTLRYKFAAGQTQRYVFTMDLEGIVGTAASNIPMREHMTMNLTQSVQIIRDSDGAATLLETIDSMSATVNGQPLKTPEATAEAMKQGFTVVMLPTGKVLSTTGAAGAAGADSSGMMQMNQMQGLPDGPVKIGDPWRNTMTAMNLTVFARSILTGYVPDASGGGIARIETKFYGTSGSAGATVPNAPMKMYMLMTGSGATEFDNGAGCLKSMSATLDQKLTISPLGSSAGKNGMPHKPVTTSLVMKMRMELAGPASAAPGV